MADYAENLTLRAKIKYRVQGEDHEFQMRGALDGDAADVDALLGKMYTFLNAAAGIRWTDWVVLTHEYALPGSDVFLPHSAPSTPALSAGTASIGSRTDAYKAVQCRFEAKSITGVRSSITLFGVGYTPGAGTAVDFRIATTEDPAIEDCVTALSETAPACKAADGSDLIWFLYANVKSNDHIVDKLRG